MSRDKWEPTGDGEEQKATTRPDNRSDNPGGTVTNTLRSERGDRENHSNTWERRDSDGNLKGGGSHPPKRDWEESKRK